jgi:hypothetical protein
VKTPGLLFAPARPPEVAPEAMAPEAQLVFTAPAFSPISPPM